MVFDSLRDCMVSSLMLTEAEAQEIDLGTTAADVEKWDSMGHLSLIVALEERFGIQFEDDEVVKLGSLEAILRAVQSKTV